MFEPTETESPETLDEAAAVLAEILRRAKEEPEALHAAPASTPVGRPDEMRRRPPPGGAVRLPGGLSRA